MTTRASAGFPILNLVLALGTAGIAQAQIPDKFTNLHVLPKEIGREELVSIMRGFSSALGVRCKTCHVGESDTSLEGYDFASDEQEKKRVARAMMRMTDRINGELLPATGRKSPMQVRCVTCHRGVDEPHGLDEILLHALDKDGVEAALSKYRELRKEYYGSGAYDFGPGPIEDLAEMLAQERQDVKSALALMQLNVETNPDAVKSLVMLAQLYKASDLHGKARATLERVLVLDPDNIYARRMLEPQKPGEGHE